MTELKRYILSILGGGCKDKCDSETIGKLKKASGIHKMRVIVL